jgi:hypothetical protein
MNAAPPPSRLHVLEPSFSGSHQLSFSSPTSTPPPDSLTFGPHSDNFNLPLLPANRERRLRRSIRLAKTKKNTSERHGPTRRLGKPLFSRTWVEERRGREDRRCSLFRFFSSHKDDARSVPRRSLASRGVCFGGARFFFLHLLCLFRLVFVRPDLQLHPHRRRFHVEGLD